MADDLAQETMLVVLNKLRAGQLNHVDRLGGYVVSTARYLWIGKLRRADTNRIVYVESLDREDIELGFTSQSTYGWEDSHQDAQQRFRNRLLKVLNSLRTARDRDILTRYFVYEQTKSQICVALALSPDQFDKVLFRARRRLRKSVLDVVEDGDIAEFLSA